MLERKKIKKCCQQEKYPYFCSVNYLNKQLDTEQ